MQPGGSLSSRNAHHSRDEPSPRTPARRSLVRQAFSDVGPGELPRMERNGFIHPHLRMYSKASRAIKVRKSEDAIIPPAELVEAVKSACAFLDDTLKIEKYERHITTAVFDKVQSEFLAKFGFAVERRPSQLPDAGYGASVCSGLVRKHQLVALYPGTVYRNGEPIFLQSIANHFVFRCIDGTLIDGNTSGLSGIIYKSCSYRDRRGSHLVSDLTWLTELPVNPLCVGQYVNNHTQEIPPNVAYQEVDLDLNEFPAKYRRFLGNIPYNSLLEGSILRLVALVSLRDIEAGEELFSSYLTMVT